MYKSIIYTYVIFMLKTANDVGNLDADIIWPNLSILKYIISIRQFVTDNRPIKSLYFSCTKTMH